MTSTSFMTFARRPRLAASVASLALAFAAACASQPAASDDGSAGAPSGSAAPGGQQGERAAIDRMIGDAKVIAKVDGCGPSGQCATIGIGERACGGPSEYIVYCPLTTDTAALRRKVADVARAERAFNQKYGIASTCEFRMPPAVENVGGTCRAAAANRVP
jgi:hypothetical protein